MKTLSRRRWLAAAAAGLPLVHSSCVYGRTASAGPRVAAFRVDVTPPLGHPLLGGNFRPARQIGDPLWARGLVFTDGDRPAAIVSLDWCELRNDAHAAWRAGLAQALGTEPEQVLIHCVHQHDAPYVDLGAQRLLDEVGLAGRMCDARFHQQAVERVAAAARTALTETKPLTHLARGRAVVEQVASNRRVVRPDGTPYYGRYSTCRDAALREQPAGEFDPHLTSLVFYSGDRLVAALRAFAVHPMSPYGQGIVSADFVGDARTRRERDLPEVVHLYGTGCAGDVTAGKYNDGSAEARSRLAERLYDAMLRADRAAERRAVERVAVRHAPVVLPFWNVPQLGEDALLRTLRDEKSSLMPRVYAALGLSSRQHNRARHGVDGHRIDLQVIDFGPAQIALYPAESFVSFQLQVQEAVRKARPEAFVQSLGFGECAPGYMPTAAAVREGFREEHGYCWVDDSAERRIVDGMTNLLCEKA